MVRSILIYFIGLIIVSTPRIFSQSIEVYAATDTTHYLIGDFIHFSVEVTHDEEIQVIPPVFPDTLKKIEVIQVLPAEIDESNSKIAELYSFVLGVYDSTDIIIPPVSIYYKTAGDSVNRVINTYPVEITVHSINVNLSNEIQDVKKPLYIEFNWLFVIILTTSLIILSIVGYLLYRRYKKKKENLLPEKRIILVPPHKAALKALWQLEEKKLWQQGKIKQYHTEVTGIIRKYFEDRFGFLALEMTSSEILDNIIKKSDTVYDITRDFLNNADLVKFAKFIPLPSINESMLKQAYEIVNRTMPEEKVEAGEKLEYVE